MQIHFQVKITCIIKVCFNKMDISYFYEVDKERNFDILLFSLYVTMARPLAYIYNASCNFGLYFSIFAENTGFLQKRLFLHLNTFYFMNILELFYK